MRDGSRVSYAQNFEDLLLDRVFRDQGTGFFVDVGAGDPVKYSVTLKFYQRGWRGLNLEPSPDLWAALTQARPGDTNLNIALGDASSQLTLYHCGVRELSTLDADVAAAIRQAGHPVDEVAVEVRTLADVLSEQRGDKTIDFLKIDVEGWEAKVLAGADFERFRPRILVIEATVPNTRRPSHEAWEPGLLACGFTFGWFDGLNRFYVRNEDRVLLEHFQMPVNVFDGVAPYDMFEFAHARERATLLQTEVQRLHAELAAAQVVAAHSRQGWLRRTFG